MNHDKNNDELQDAINRIEASVKNSQDGIKKLFLHSTRQEIAIETLDNKVDALDNRVDALESKVDANQQENRQRFDAMDKRFDAMDKRFEAMDRRFDKVEETLSIIINHLQK